MDARVKIGIAQLEEFLQEEYVGNYEKIENNDNKVSGLIEVHPNYFYVPASNGYGNLEYIEYDGKALYLINKSGLPQEIQEQLVGGDAGSKEYVDYLGLNDVYGVTKGLKVYYCSNGIDSIENLAKEDLDKAEDKPLFEAGEGSAGLGKLLKNYDSNNNGKVDSSEVSSIKELEIRETTDLTGIYNLYGLEKITIIDVPEINLEGIQNCLKLSTVWLYNSKAPSYEPIGKLKDRLVRLYISHGDDSQIERLCTDIGKYDLTSLEYLGFFGGSSYYGYGPESLLNLTERGSSGWGIIRKGNLKSLLSLGKLSELTKKKIKYFYAPGNYLSDLDGIDNLSGLTLLSVPANIITSLNGIGNSNSSIKYLQLQGNLMTDREVNDIINDSLSKITNLSNLYWLDISKNEGIENISYLKGLPNLKYLYMDGLLNVKDIGSMRGFFSGLIDKTYESKYSLDLFNVNTLTLDLHGKTIGFGDFKDIEKCVNLTKLDLGNVTVKKNENEQIEENENTVEEIMDEVFSKLTKLQILGINNLQFDFEGSGHFEKVKSLSFLKLEDMNDGKLGLKNTLLRLDLRNTEVIAKGNMKEEVSGIDEIESELSEKNTDILNSLTNLKNILINTDKFDFSKLQVMLNRFSTTRFGDFGSVTMSGGLFCTDEMSLETLENCHNLKKLYCLSREYNIGDGNNVHFELDLSSLKNLKDVYVLMTSGDLKVPRDLDRLYLWLSPYLNVSFGDDNGEKGYIREFTMSEFSIFDNLENLINSKIFCDTVNLPNILADVDCDMFLDETGNCNWLDGLYLSTASWVIPSDKKLKFCDTLSTLKNSSIRRISLTITGERDLGFVKNLTQLESVKVLSKSHIDNIGALKPIYNDGNLVSGCPDLETLDLSNNKIADISILGDLTKLESINFSNNIISSGIENLSELENLTYINLSKNNLTTNLNYINDLVSKNAKNDFINIFKTLHETVKTETKPDGTQTDIYLKDLDLGGTGIVGIMDVLKSSNAKPWTTLNCDG